MIEKKQASPYRWAVLFSIVPIIVSTEMMWLSLSPISSLAEDFYGVGSFAITLFTMSYMMMFIVFCLPASWVIDKYGYRASLMIGAILTGVFGIARFAFAENFNAVIIFQFIIAAGQPFLLNISTKVPANWFPLSERATAAGILTMAQYVGFALPMVLAPLLAEQAGIPQVFKVFAVIAIISAALSILFTRERPKIPPEGPVAEKEDFSVGTLKKLLGNKAYILPLIICFISMGIFNTLLTLIESILMPRGITSMEAGIIGAAFVIAGVLGAVILPIISDALKRRIPFFALAIALLGPLYLGLTFINGFLPLIVVAGLAGFSIMGVAPILFQHSSEVAYPVQEGTSLGVILLMGQISGIVFVFLFELLAGGGIVLPMLILVGLTVIEVPIALRLKESPILQGERVKPCR